MFLCFAAWFPQLLSLITLQGERAELTDHTYMRVHISTRARTRTRIRRQACMSYNIQHSLISCSLGKYFGISAAWYATSLTDARLRIRLERGEDTRSALQAKRPGRVMNSSRCLSICVTAACIILYKAVLLWLIL